VGLTAAEAAIRSRIATLARRTPSSEHAAMKALLSALLAGTLAVPPGAGAAPLSPSQKWVVEFADQQCVASRNYGSSAKPLILVLKPSPMGKVLQMTFIREASGPTEQIGASIQIGSGRAIRTTALAFDARRAKRRMVRINLPDENSERLAEATTLAVRIDGEVDESLALSHMGELMRAMGRCLADLQGYWNLGPANETRLRERAQGNLAQWFKAEDYPDMAIREDQRGTVQFALLIDEAGKVADCTVTETSKAPVLDAQSCSVLVSRAKLRPATGLDGKPAKDGLTGRVTWRIP
jgi:TonB family protein